jgi:16S rRNA (guanine1207-N2)-methyltransferase
MSEHYFTPSPAGRPRRRQIEAVLRGRRFRFLTEAGVFSPDRVDRGTRLLVEAMEVGEQEVVLDLGCGYGAAGIAAAALAKAGRVYLVDINQRAARLAGENLALNGIANAEARAGDGPAAVAGLRFDVILLNPPLRAGKEVVARLIREARGALRPGGRFYLVARTRQGAKTLARKLEEEFGAVTEVRKGGGYRVYRCLRAGLE